MKKAILPDYIFRNIESKRHDISILAHVSKLTAYFTVLPDNTWAFKYFEGGPLSSIDFNSYSEEVLRDRGAGAYFQCLANYNRENNYIFSKSLTQALTLTDMEISRDYLPSTFNGYFELPGVMGYDSKECLGIFATIFDGPKGKLLTMVLIDSEKKEYPSFSYVRILLDRPTLKECVKSCPIIHDVVVSGAIIGKREEEFSKVPDFFVPIINAIVFAANTQAPLQLNSFEGNENAVKTQKKIFTHLPYRSFGEDFVMPREQHVDATVVAGHFRWQPHGEGRKLLKHIYISPFVRRYEKSEKL